MCVCVCVYVRECVRVCVSLCVTVILVRIVQCNRQMVFTKTVLLFLSFPFGAV